MIDLRSPLEAPWTSAALELSHLILALLLLRAALRDRRAGDGAALAVLLAAAIYGSFLDLGALVGVGGFEHGRFTVMIAGRLPLYIALMYVNHLGLSWRLLAEARAPRWSRAAAAGVCGVLLDGAMQGPGQGLGWWAWQEDNPLFAARVAGIPVANLLWGALFPAAFLLLADRARARLATARGARALGLALGVALGTPLLGTLFFLPWHGLVALGVDPNLGGLLLLAGVAGLSLPALLRARLPGALRAPVLVYLSFLVLAGTLAPSVEGAPGLRIASLLMALGLALAMGRGVSSPKPHEKMESRM